jgi:hypothetical protein
MKALDSPSRLRFPSSIIGGQAASRTFNSFDAFYDARFCDFDYRSCKLLRQHDDRGKATTITPNDTIGADHQRFLRIFLAFTATFFVHVLRQEQGARRQLDDPRSSPTHRMWVISISPSPTFARLHLRMALYHGFLICQGDPLYEQKLGWLSFHLPF